LERNVIEGYAEDAVELIPRFEAVSPEKLFAPVAHLLPNGPIKIADLGAGTGVAAAWFASRGQHVLAVEPVTEFRKMGKKLHKSQSIEWLDDTLPQLSQTLARGETFDLVLLSAVWHHLNADQRRCALPNLRALIAPEGLLIMSLRNGPGAPNRPCHETHPDELIDLAITEGLNLVFRQNAESVQIKNRTAGVTWTWLVFSINV